jgi:hypothetical protein
MPQYPPPLRLRTDNIKRVLSRRTTEGLLRAIGMLLGRSGMWPENDPESYAAYLSDLLNDPRLRRTRAEHIKADHPDADLRLDRCRAKRLTLSCQNCRVSAVYTLEDLWASFGGDYNIMQLPSYLMPCRNKREQRDGACRVRAEPGGFDDCVCTVAEARIRAS